MGTNAEPSGDEPETVDPKSADAAANSGDGGDDHSNKPNRADTEGIVVEVDDSDDSDEEAEGEPSVDDQIAALEVTAKEHYERLLRTTADFENFRKRSRRDLADARVDEQSRVLREMLPVLDNLERAIAAANSDSDEVKSIRQGIELVLRQFSQALERFSVAKVEALGEVFDPNIHEAVSQLETTDQPAGTVMTVLQPGYRIGERLLRAALTVVAKAPAEPAPEPAVVEPSKADTGEADAGEAAEAGEADAEIDEGEVSE